MPSARANRPDFDLPDICEGQAAYITRHLPEASGALEARHGMSPDAGMAPVDLSRDNAFRPERRSASLIPRFDGAILSQEWKEALRDKFVTGAPRPRTPSEQRYSDRKSKARPPSVRGRD